MKKSLLFIPMLSSLATLPLLIASKCDQKETQEQKDENLPKNMKNNILISNDMCLMILINLRWNPNIFN